MYRRNSRSHDSLLIGLLFVLPAVAAQEKPPTPIPQNISAKQAPASLPDESDYRKRREDEIKSRGSLRNHNSFKMVLQSALPPGRISRDEGYEKSFNSRFFLFVVWLNYGDPRFGRDYALAENGRETGARYMFPEGDYAIQGGDQHEKNDATCRELRAISLPKGLSSPYAVPYSRLLVVGIRTDKTDNTWQVRYYDRDNLPKEIQTITRLTNLPYEE